MEFEILEEYKDLTEIEQGMSLLCQISDIYERLSIARWRKKEWLETHDEADWKQMLSEVGFAKSLTAMSLSDRKVSRRDKRTLKETVTTMVELLMDPQAGVAELERWISLLMRWYNDPRTGKFGHRLKVPREMRKK